MFNFSRLNSIFLLFFLSISTFSFAQIEEKKRWYEDSEKDIIEYVRIQVEYYRDKDSTYQSTHQEVYNLVRDTIKKMIIGSYLKEYDFIKFDGDTLSTQNLKKPMVFMVNRIEDDCSFCIEQIRVFNKLANKYHNEIAFIFMSLGLKTNTLKNINRLNKNIACIPMELNGDNVSEASGFKNLINYPMIYFITCDRKITGIQGYLKSQHVRINKEGEEIPYTEKELLQKYKEEEEITDKILLDLIELSKQ